MFSKNTKNYNQNTKNSNQTAGNSLKDKLNSVREADNKEMQAKNTVNLDAVDKTLEAMEKVHERLSKANADLLKAYETGNPHEIAKCEAIKERIDAEYNKLKEQIPQEVKDQADKLDEEDSDTKNEEEQEMKVNNEVKGQEQIAKEEVAATKGKSSVPGMTSEDMKKASAELDKKLEGTIKMQENDPLKSDASNKVNAEDIKGAVGSEMIANGEATKEQVEEASKTDEVNAEAQKAADEINKANEEKKEDAPKEEEKKEDAPKEEEKKEDAPKEEMTEDDKLIAQFKKDNENKDKPEDKKEDKPQNTNKNKKELVPKAWQRVSDDGNSLINVITFMSEKHDYSVGMKHRYRFPNLSVSDGMNRIVTAKFPKEDVKAVVEHIEFKGYTIDIEKYGNSAVCKLHDPDGICMLEFVSLATVIDVLQDELNEGNECAISWGTIDQIIKHKRGLKSRIKSLADNDEPARQRGGAKKEETVDTKAESEAAPTSQAESIKQLQDAVAQ